MTLKVYRQKRNFKKTTEPAGKVSKTKNDKRIYIIQKHAASHLHYDFRLELNGVLLSWAVPKGPCLDPAVKRLAMHVEDHPLEYANFEGIIPKGEYGGGTVMLWDKGEWISKDINPTQAYHNGNLTFELQGKKLKGLWKLVKIKTTEKSWLLIKITDRYAKPLSEYDITKEEPYSVVSKRDLNEIAENAKQVWTSNGSEKPTKKKESHPTQIKITTIKTRFPSQISPQLATLVDKPPSGREWLHEIKFDGYRLLAFKRENNVRLMTRNNNDWTSKFKTIVTSIKNLTRKDAIFDGEVVVLDDQQHSNFQLLQNSIKENIGKPFLYYIFDLIYYDQYNLSTMPLIERKKILATIMQNNKDANLHYSDHVFGSGKEIFAKSCKLGLEGIVSKDSTCPYVQRRTRTWLKIKCLKRQEFIICGFTPPQGNRKYFGSLLLGTYNKKNELIYHGNVGTGFTESSLKSIYNFLEKNITQEIPFKTRPPATKNVTWVRPVIIAEVEFSEWTKDNILRQPSFKGLRSDKAPQNITKEKVIQIKNIKLTNPDKTLYPEDGITKRDLVEYYARIQEWILPYIINRPLTLVRCPDDYKKCFYQKHLNKTMPSVLHGIKISHLGMDPSFRWDDKSLIYIGGVDGLLALPQLGVLEIHPWESRIDNLEHPDIMIFDLDPAPDVAWKRVVETAFEIKKILADYKLKTFVKTTGGKGLHVVIPIKPEYDWEQVKLFARTVVQYMVEQQPQHYVAKMTKAKRIGKIFIDYMRNNRGATAIAPYSTRARPHAPVATPIDWDELTSNPKDTYYTIKTLPKRLDNLRTDPWKNFFKIKQSLRLEKLIT